MIALIGFTGAGKSMLGRSLTMFYGLPCYDVDTLIEKQTGCTIARLFSEHGEAYFRAVEENVIASLLQSQSTSNNCVIVTGGGAVLSENTRSLLYEHCFVVHVYAPLDVIVDRLRADQSRPLLQGTDFVEALAALHAARETLYDFAHVKIEMQNSYQAASLVLGKWLHFSYRQTNTEGHAALRHHQQEILQRKTL